MSVNDPIADMLTRIRNAVVVSHADVAIPHSTIKEEIARVLHQEGFVEGYSVVAEAGRSYQNIVIQLKYVGVGRERKPVISGLTRVSKPGRRIYATHKDIPWVLSGMGIAVLSTPKGVMTGHQARRQKVGGEVLCAIW